MSPKMGQSGLMLRPIAEEKISEKIIIETTEEDMIQRK